jgi:hypothetical protein
MTLVGDEGVIGFPDRSSDTGAVVFQNVSGL